MVSYIFVLFGKKDCMRVVILQNTFRYIADSVNIKYMFIMFIYSCLFGLMEDTITVLVPTFPDNNDAACVLYLPCFIPHLIIHVWYCMARTHGRRTSYLFTASISDVLYRNALEIRLDNTYLLSLLWLAQRRCVTLAVTAAMVIVIVATVTRHLQQWLL